MPALLIAVIDHKPSRDGLVSMSGGGGSLSWAITNAAESALVHHMFYQMVHHMFTR